MQKIIMVLCLLLSGVIAVAMVAHPPTHPPTDAAPDPGADVGNPPQGATEDGHPADIADIADTADTADRRHRGVSWVADGPIDGAALDPLVGHGVNWIVQTPFGWQTRIDSPEVRLVTGGRVLWGETDEGLRVTTRLAADRGIATMLKPHIWITDRSGGWRGEIAMKNDEDWAAWFASYDRFVLHYARLAEETGMKALCIGTELASTVETHETEWRRLIAEIRSVYSGQLTYAANWHAEFEVLRFWDDLDYIGIQAYFPLSHDDDPSVDDLQRGWRTHLPLIESVQKRYGKPVLFTELGYRSMPDAAQRPWEWPQRGAPVAVDTALQDRCYEAFYRTFWHKPWFGGIYWWKWFPAHANAGGPANHGFTPQNKPAEATMARWFAEPAKRAAPAAATP